SDDDLWAEAFADQENLEQTATEKDTEEESAALPKEAPAEGKSGEKSDDDLWAEAFADQENLEQAATEKDTEEESAAATDEEGPAEETDATGEDQPSPEDEDETAEEDAEEDENAREEQDEAPEDQDGHEDEEEAWKKELEEQYADDYDEEEFQFKKKKFGPFTLPATKTGKIILAGSVAAVLLTGGGAYFALQTLAPPELVKMGKTPSEVPDGLKPNAGQESAASTDPAAGPAPADQPPAPESNAVKEPNSSPEPSGSGKPPGDELLAKADEGPREGLVAALSPKNKSVELSTIMPVAYNVNDIRVLSFQLEMEMSDEDSAEIVRGALPVFEKITVRTVEQVLERKFFNDILYVKEKLQKKLQKNYNKVIEGGGKVKKIKFKEFEIQ
ncbi:MAG: hypothetical protein ACE5E9_14260, partial [Nitrospinaceae bacterium]